MVFARAPQPTDIIWENRVKEPRLQKLIFGSVALFILFTFDLLATFSFNDAQLDLINKYDTKIDCQNLMRVPGIERQTTDAWLEYQSFRAKSNTFPGIVSCFC